jgi:hypothetical protein
VQKLDPRRPLVVPYIMAVAAIPAGFDHVNDIVAGSDERSVRLISRSGKSVSTPLRVDFLHAKAGG